MLPRKCLLALVLLFSGLAHADLNSLEKHNFTICNDTRVVANVAIKQRVDSPNLQEVQVIGWYQVHPYTCMRMGQRETNLALYAYGIENGRLEIFTSNNQAPSESDASRVCVKSGSFQLQGEELRNCDESETRTYVINDQTEVWRINSYQ